jgi:hypothetical protein
MKKTKSNPINALRRLETKEKDLNEKLEKIYKGKKAIAERLKKEPYRITDTSENVVELRQKIMRVKEIRGVLEKYKIPIEEVAILFCWDERIHDHGHPSKIDSFAMRHNVITSPRDNMWTISERYVYGGPEDRIRVFWNRYKKGNRQPYICGFMTNFPMKVERKAT